MQPAKLFAASKKAALESVTATLSKTTERTDATEGMMRGLELQLSDAKIANAIHEHIDENLQETLSHAGYNRQSMNADLKRSVEQARKALHEALTRNGNLTWVMGPGATNLEALTLEGELAAMAEQVLAKTSSRSVLGVMNEFAPHGRQLPMDRRPHRPG